MSIFFNKNKKRELVMLVNFGSSSVAGSLFWADENGKPEILFSAREFLVCEAEADIEKILISAIKALDILLGKLVKSGFGKPERFFCSLSSLWYFSQSRIIKLDRNTPFSFTKDFFESLVEKEMSFFQKGTLDKFKNLGTSIRLLEFEHVSTRLNGYLTDEPFGKKAKQLEISIFASMSEEKILSKIEECFFRHFHNEEVEFFSSLFSIYSLVRNSFATQRDFLLINISGEITEISLVQKGVLKNSNSFPMGYNFFTRGVAREMNTDLFNAESMVSLYKDGHMGENSDRKFLDVIVDLKKKWLASFQSALSGISEDIAVPSDIFISMGRNFADFFSGIIKNEQFFQYALAESKFNILFIDSKILFGAIDFGERARIRDPFVILETLYINNFICYNKNMSKNLLQDMRRQTASSGVSTASNQDKLKQSSPEEDGGHSSGRTKYRLYLLAIISALALFFALSFMFSEAKVNVYPKIKDISLKSNLVALEEKKGDGLAFDLVVLSGEEKKVMEGLPIEDMKIQATGTVLIYNGYSSAPQTLDVDTRLEGSNGKIYKTNKKIIVPGMSKDKKPGSVRVGIYASEGGTEYNSAPLDFKIFGFKGTPKYEKFYARSEGEITGGFTGLAPKISSLDKSMVMQELKSALEAKLSKKISEQIPKGSVFFDGASTLYMPEKNVTFETDKENNTAQAVASGSLYAFVFNEKDLSRKIAKDVVDKYTDEDIYIQNIKDLKFSFLNPDGIDFPNVRSVELSLSGKPKMVWRLDEEKFLVDLLDKEKSQFDSVLEKYPNIESASLTLRPFWRSSLPKEVEDIELLVNYPN